MKLNIAVKSLVLIGLATSIVGCDRVMDSYAIASTSAADELRSHIAKDKAEYESLKSRNCEEVQKYTLRYVDNSGAAIINGQLNYVVSSGFSGNPESIWSCPDGQVYSYKWDFPSHIAKLQLKLNKL